MYQPQDAFTYLNVIKSKSGEKRSSIVKVPVICPPNENVTLRKNFGDRNVAL